MPPVPVGQPSGGGGVMGIPTKYLLLGGGGLALAFFLMQQRGGAPVASDPNAPTYGAALGPNAALALGDLSNRIGRESGLLQEQLQGYFGGLGDSISGLSAHLDEQAGALSDQGTALSGAISALSGQVGTGFGNVMAGQQSAESTNASQWAQFQHWFSDLYAQSEITWRLMHGFHGAQATPPVGSGMPTGGFADGIGYAGAATA